MVSQRGKQAQQSFMAEGCVLGWTAETYQTSGLQARRSCVDPSHSRHCLVIVDEPFCMYLNIWRIWNQVLLSAK